MRLLEKNEAKLLAFFFFSSRRRHTRFSRDWSSDVCSSDLWSRCSDRTRSAPGPASRVSRWLRPGAERSEERRVGKERSSRREPYHRQSELLEHHGRNQHQVARPTLDNNPHLLHSYHRTPAI